MFAGCLHALETFKKPGNETEIRTWHKRERVYDSSKTCTRKQIKSLKHLTQIERTKIIMMAELRSDKSHM